MKSKINPIIIIASTLRLTIAKSVEIEILDQSLKTFLGFDVDSFFYVHKNSSFFDNDSPFLNEYIVLKKKSGKKDWFKWKIVLVFFWH